MRAWVALLVAAWLGACTASDDYIDNGKLSQLAVGRTTYSDVTTSWGQPARTSTLPDGRRVAVYPYIWLQTGAVTFISGAGPVSSSETRTGEVTLTFDATGVLQSYAAPR